MYAGRIVEQAGVKEVFSHPHHPYTWGLLGSIPSLASKHGDRLVPVPGQPPSLISVPSGCSFHPRCPYVRPRHAEIDPQLEPLPDDSGHLAACLLDPATRARLSAKLEGGATPRRRAARSGWRPRWLSSCSRSRTSSSTSRSRAGSCSSARSAPCRPSTTSPSRSPPARRWGSSGRRGAARPRRRSSVRLIEPTSGSIRFDGEDVTTASGAALKQLRREMQVVFQDPYSSLNPRRTVGSIIADPLAIHGVAGTPGSAPARPGADGAGRPQPRALQPLPAPVLGRAAPADRDRPRAGAQPSARRPRRAGLGARRLDPGAGDQPARRAAVESSGSPTCSSPTTSASCATSPTASP